MRLSFVVSDATLWVEMGGGCGADTGMPACHRNVTPCLPRLLKPISQLGTGKLDADFP